ncbi:MAG: hypothetical protein IJ228_03710 [Succinivibrio sp.]|nr:hypothetical protein [Succinivibrio sp.]
MIKLQRGEPPQELAKEHRSLTQDYLHNHNTKVWQQDYIIRALRAMSANKCCYCELKFKAPEQLPQLPEARSSRSDQFTVEHFHPRKICPEEVVAWHNLLPCCGRCNSQKGDFDTRQLSLSTRQMTNRGNICL